MELAASQQTGNWKWKQVDGTEIKDPLEPHYITTRYVCIAVVKFEHFDVSIHIARKPRQRYVAQT